MKMQKDLGFVLYTCVSIYIDTLLIVWKLL